MWYNILSMISRRYADMTIAKIALAVLVCVPLVALIGVLFNRLADEVVKKQH